jgi:hypothetical protein
VDAKTVRMKIAAADILVGQFAALTDVPYNTLSDILHERRPITPEMASRIERGLAQLEANPPARLVVTRGTPRKTEVAS